MTKVCHLTSVHPIDDIRIFYKECTSLAKNGYEVTLIAFGAQEYVETKNGVECISLKTPVRNRLQRFIKRSNVIYQKALEVQADIYHLHDPELLLTALKLKKNGHHVIFDAHEDFPKQILQKTYIPILLRKPIAIIAKIIDKKVTTRLDNVVCAAPSISNKYLQWNCKSVEIRNYPILKNIAPISHNNNKQKAICYAGGISEIRGITNLLDAIVETNYKIILAGLFSDAKYEQSLKEHKGWKQVDYRGFVSQKELYEIYAESSIGIGLFHPSPNHVDGITTKLYEYMYAGIPVIISDSVKSNREVVEKHQCGIVVNPFKRQEIVNAIHLLMNNDKLAQEMGENGRNAVLDHYSWKNEENKLIAMYNNLKTL